MKQFLQTKSLAITSLVFGILALAFSGGLIGLAFALVAIAIGFTMKQSGDLTGRKKTRWGLGLGVSSIIILVAIFTMEVRTQRAVYELHEWYPELFNAYLEKPTVTAPVQRRPRPQGPQTYEQALQSLARSIAREKSLQQSKIPTSMDLKDCITQVSLHQTESVKIGVWGYMDRCGWGGFFDKATLGVKPMVEAANLYAAVNRFQDDRYNPTPKGNDARETDRNSIIVYLEEQARRVKPDLAEAHCSLGIAYSKLGRYQEATKAFKQGIRIKPNLAEAHCNLGVAYSKLDRYQKAIESYMKALKIKPDYAYAHNNLGAAYLKTGDKGSAIEECKILKTLDAEQANKLFKLIYK